MAHTIPTPHTPLVRNFFFWSGVVATVLYRAIIIMNHVSAFWAEIFWYVGTAGFILYFAHRYQIAKRRGRLLTESRLLEKVKASNIAPEDQAAFEYVLGTLQTSKERLMNIIIFVTSAVGLIVGAYLDFFR